MSQVPQHLIDEATRRGIVPGAMIRCATWKEDYGTVGPVSKWVVPYLAALIVGECDNNRTRLRAQFARATHCKNGHPFSGDNLVMEPYKYGVRRTCRICKNTSKAMRRKLNKTN